MGDQRPFPHSHHSPDFPPEVIDFYCHIFGEHARVEDIVRCQEAIHESSQRRNLNNGYEHIGCTSQLAEDEQLAIALQNSEMDLIQNLSAIGSNTTGIRHTDVNDTYGGDTSRVGIIQDDIDPDRMTYEELQALDELNGSVAKGLSENILSKLSSHKYKSGSSSKSSHKAIQDHNECDICKMDYQVNDIVTILPCAHKYHKQCIFTWLKDNKNCCICKTEVVIS